MPVSLGTGPLAGLRDGLDAGGSASSATPLDRQRAAPHRRSPGPRPKTTLAAIFGPQHGFRSDVQENMIETGHARDALRRVPVYSALQRDARATAEMLRDVDVLVVDLQDVGTRIYTTSTRWPTAW